jgi:hypothetical protein
MAAKRIADKLLELGKKQNWLAVEAGVAPSVLKRFLEGGGCTIETLAALAKPLGIETWELLKPINERDESIAGDDSESDKSWSGIPVKGVAADDDGCSKAAEQDSDGGPGQPPQYVLATHNGPSEIKETRGGITSKKANEEIGSGPSGSKQNGRPAAILSDRKSSTKASQNVKQDDNPAAMIHTLPSDIAEQILSELKSKSLQTIAEQEKEIEAFKAKITRLDRISAAYENATDEIRAAVDQALSFSQDDLDRAEARARQSPQEPSLKKS